jgi:hypothetical protein
LKMSTGSARNNLGWLKQVREAAYTRSLAFRIVGPSHRWKPVGDGVEGAAVRHHAQLPEVVIALNCNCTPTPCCALDENGLDEPPPHPTTATCQQRARSSLAPDLAEPRQHHL